MRAYLWLWAGGLVLSAATGVVLCLVLVSPGIWGVLGFLAAVAAVVVRPGIVEHARRRRLRAPGTIELAAVAVTAAVAATGWGAAAGSLALLVVLAHTATAAPLVVGHRNRHRESRRSGRADVVGDAEPRGDAYRRAHRHLEPSADIAARLGPVVATWSDDQLCVAWGASLHRLDSDDPFLLAAVAWERQLYLDEIERRHPRGFARWLGANPRAGSDPHRFLRFESPPRRPGPAG